MIGTMKTDSGKVTSVRKARYLMTRDTEKCPLSALTSVRVKQVTFRENVSHIV